MYGTCKGSLYVGWRNRVTLDPIELVIAPAGPGQITYSIRGTPERAAVTWISDPDLTFVVYMDSPRDLLTFTGTHNGDRLEGKMHSDADRYAIGSWVTTRGAAGEGEGGPPALRSARTFRRGRRPRREARHPAPRLIVAPACQ